MTDEDKKTEEIIEEETFDKEDIQGLVEKIKKAKEQLKHCQAEKHEYLTGWQRSQADFINYKRRQEEQLAEWLAMAGEKIIREILPVLDTLDSFFGKHAAHDEKLDKKHLTEGLIGVKKQLADILSKNGLKEIKSIGEKFNHEFHEAVEQAESDKEGGIIIEEVQKGYSLNGKILRPAKVKVSK